MYLADVDDETLRLLLKVGFLHLFLYKYNSCFPSLSLGNIKSFTFNQLHGIHNIVHGFNEYNEKAGDRETFAL